MSLNMSNEFEVHFAHYDEANNVLVRSLHTKAGPNEVITAPNDDKLEVT